MNALNRTIHQVIITHYLWSVLWNQGIVLFARLKSRTVSFIGAKKEKMVTTLNAKYAGRKKTVNGKEKTLNLREQSIRDGRTKTLNGLEVTKENTTKGIKKKSFQKCVSQEKKTTTQLQRSTDKKIDIRLIVITLLLLLSNLVISTDLQSVTDVKFIVSHMVIMTTMTSLWKSFGFVESVMGKNIEWIRQRERPSLETPLRGCDGPNLRGNRKRMGLNTRSAAKTVSRYVQVPKVTEWLRHTAGCNFYQGQCITNDLWVQNLRSTGLKAA